MMFWQPYEQINDKILHMWHYKSRKINSFGCRAFLFFYDFGDIDYYYE